MLILYSCTLPIAIESNETATVRRNQILDQASLEGDLTRQSLSTQAILTCTIQFSIETACSIVIVKSPGMLLPLRSSCLHEVCSFRLSTFSGISLDCFALSQLWHLHSRFAYPFFDCSASSFQQHIVFDEALSSVFYQLYHQLDYYRHPTVISMALFSTMDPGSVPPPDLPVEVVKMICGHAYAQTSNLPNLRLVCRHISYDATVIFGKHHFEELCFLYTEDSLASIERICRSDLGKYVRVLKMSSMIVSMVFSSDNLQYLSARDPTHHPYLDGQIHMDSSLVRRFVDRYNTQIALATSNKAEQHLRAAMQSINASLTLNPRSIGLAIASDETGFLGVTKTFRCQRYLESINIGLWENNFDEHLKLLLNAAEETNLGVQEMHVDSWRYDGRLFNGLIVPFVCKLEKITIGARHHEALDVESIRALQSLLFPATSLKSLTFTGDIFRFNDGAMSKVVSRVNSSELEEISLYMTVANEAGLRILLAQARGNLRRLTILLENFDGNWTSLFRFILQRAKKLTYLRLVRHTCGLRDVDELHGLELIQTKLSEWIRGAQ
ncbi:hypothetical protein E4T47_07748 [Aureobasidium subglaciale]|nr:hypothetical protein E4T47_07748 [Aureobasidium subglaciale]